MARMSSRQAHAPEGRALFYSIIRKGTGYLTCASAALERQILFTEAWNQVSQR